MGRRIFTFGCSSADNPFTTALEKNQVPLLRRPSRWQLLWLFPWSNVSASFIDRWSGSATLTRRRARGLPNHAAHPPW